MKLSRRKMELMLVDIAVIICVYYMTNLVKVLRLHSIVLNGEINLARMLALVVTIMAGASSLAYTATFGATPTYRLI